MTQLCVGTLGPSTSSIGTSAQENNVSRGGDGNGSPISVRQVSNSDIRIIRVKSAVAELSKGIPGRSGGKIDSTGSSGHINRATVISPALESTVTNHGVLLLLTSPFSGV